MQLKYMFTWKWFSRGLVSGLGAFAVAILDGWALLGFLVGVCLGLFLLKRYPKLLDFLVRENKDKARIVELEKQIEELKHKP